MHFGFIGHSFHDRSKSTQFIKDILEELGEVTYFNSDPDEGPSQDDRLISEIHSQTFDCLICLQTEALAERLRPLMSCRIIIIVMYDAAFGRPDCFWQQFKGVQFISFCRTHHEYLIELDCASASFQYAPPVRPASLRNLLQRSAFFWERRPDQAINLGLVLDLCRQLDVSHLHVHAAPDFELLKGDEYRRITQIRNVTLTWTTWFDQQGDYEKVAMAPLFFFAPRQREGIGMAALEAMSAGQIVVAPDFPSVNEYVSHATTGILYDPEKPELRLKLNEQKLLLMSQAAFKKAEVTRSNWLADVDRLKSIFLDDGRRWSTSDRSAGFVNDLRAAASRRVFKRATQRFSSEVAV